MADLPTCQKCGHTRREGEFGAENECPKCGAIYDKVAAAKTGMDKLMEKAVATGDWSKIPKSILDRMIKETMGSV